MCGIYGTWDLHHRLSGEETSRVLSEMGDRIKHRGPDQHGIWMDVEKGFSIGHRRLSILDLSESGKQPMVSSSGRYVIAYNGELYNYQEIQSVLQTAGWHFRSTSDTEVLLAAIEHYGVENALKKFVGMFAAIIWDRNEAHLYLIRDRIGEKPLYYGFINGMFWVTSEIKALIGHPLFKAHINWESVGSYFMRKYVPGPFSVIDGLYKLRPGTFLKITPENMEGNLVPTEYWSLSQVAKNGMNHPFAGSFEDAVEQLEQLLTTSIRNQMVADVPVGAFLSGGIDSSTVVAIMQSIRSQAVKTFSIGFQESHYDEAKYAAQVAEYLGTDHTELYVTSKDVLDLISKLPDIYDEPFADSSQLPTLLVSNLAKSKVQVALSGDGGDELFGGYERYLTGERLIRKVQNMPEWYRGLGSGLLTMLPLETNLWRSSQIPEKIRDYGIRWREKRKFMINLLSSGNEEQIYFEQMTGLHSKRHLLQHPFHHDEKRDNHFDIEMNWSDFEATRAMMYIDTLSYLPDDILVKVDRASMNYSLESRIPLLDKDIIEFSWRIPFHFMRQQNQGKYILRTLLSKYIPKELFDRPKKGFSIPIGKLLVNELRDWTEDLLSIQSLSESGFFNVQNVRNMWSEHKEHDQWGGQLWNVVMFQAWYAKYRKHLFIL